MNTNYWTAMCVTGPSHGPAAGENGGDDDVRDIHRPGDSKTLLKSDTLYQYILDTTVLPQEPPCLRELRFLTDKHELALMASPADEMQLLGVLVKMIGARNAIEVGVFTGNSLLATALALPDDGRVVAIDRDRRGYDAVARPELDRAGVVHKVEFRENVALDVLDELLATAAAAAADDDDGGFDFAFVDADKASYVSYHERLLRLVRVGGLVVYDNTLWGGAVAMPAGAPMSSTDRRVTATIRELNAVVAADPRVEVCQLPVADGLVASATNHQEEQMAATGAGEGKETASGGGGGGGGSLHSKTLLKSEPLYQYVLESTVFPREPDCLRELRLATANDPMAVMAASPDQVQLFGLLIELIGAKNAIEVGVFTGYSLLATALALPDDGKIVAIDVSRESYDEVGAPVIDKAGVAHKVDFRVGLAMPVLDQLVAEEENKGKFDFAFVDADKVNFLGYHERLLQLVRVGGLIAYDNTLWGGSVAAPPPPADEAHLSGRDRSLAALAREFNAVIAADRRVQPCQLAIADGVMLCRRVA
uniref:Caffeoyl-CoA O-methyltransferase n=1 Tax=Oryza punctata TaxID=4537 RepID=A0A0E0M2K9_ORYPU